MPVDLTRIGSGRTKRRIEPREIYAALPNRPWPYLRLEQGEVLKRWFDVREQRDVVIKQNTGGGKTAAGLLIAQSSINEGVGPAAYLAPDTYLAAQVRAEAGKLGIAVTDDPRSAAFASSRAILVTTLQKLINGKSVFGVAGDGRDVLELGTVVVDDAHTALAITEGQFRLTIPKDSQGVDGSRPYAQLLELFEDVLSEQSLTEWDDILAAVPQAVLRVPFWAWADRQRHVLEILRPLRESDGLKFTWPLVKDVLAISAATVTSTAVEIRPPCPPITRIPSFASAKRRVYLTATLADDSVLVTDLAADPEHVTRPVTPESASDLGDRMILAPLEINPDFDERTVRELAREVADGALAGPDGSGQPVNVVVLVPSDRRAEAWADFADHTWHVKDLEAGVAQLRAEHVGLVVLVNKYDGIDLPGDACRLLIIDGLPYFFDAAERRERAAGLTTPALLARRIQRVEQGMGRGVRDSEDYCAVLLLGPDLAQAVNQPSQRALFSPATRAQLDLSGEVAAQIAGEGLEAVRDAIAKCIGHDQQWVAVSRDALAEVRYDQTGTVRASAIAARTAFEEAARGQHAKAALILETATRKLKGADAAERGWLREQQAAYLHFVDPAEAQHVLAKANTDNPGVLRPSAGVPVVLVRATQAQASRAAQFLAATYQNGINLVLGVKALLREIDWDPERTDAAEEAFMQLGLHLGFPAERPDKRYGQGPDNLWALTGDQHAVIELKTGVKTDAVISKKDLGQLDQALGWYRKNYTDAREPLPVIMQAREECDAKGSPAQGLRVLTESGLAKLKLAVTTMTVALAQDEGRWSDETAVAEQLTAHRLHGSDLFMTYAVGAKAGKR